MRIAVTGAAGYIGRRLVRRLRAHGHHVLCIDRSPTLPQNEADELITCDLLQTDVYSSRLAGIECICHLAAAKGDWGISKEEYYRDNLDVTRALLKAAAQAQVKNWVFYSTVSVLGPSDAPIPEESPRRPINPYGASKAACEDLYEHYVRSTPGARVVMIRPSVVFGPENPESTNIFRLIDAIYRNRFIMIGQGLEVKTTSYIDNLIDAHMLLMNRVFDPACPNLDVFHYVDEPGESTAALVQRIYSLLGKRRPRLRIPLPIAAPLALVGDITASMTGVDLPITSARVKKFCTATNFSGRKLRALGYEQRVSIEEALSKTVRWYLEEYRSVRVSAHNRT